ncbi:hypothetical protein QBC35DRAFT_543148 [Podospora australis]|uniref:Mid2 domain-containing protein n=1 Tax=Podospora australis TaxID=1536484 RepID=A0AAN7AN51_9PEZI|nr:hypothetical protein QBC35DRAFT_543148 [Podospora australis]
MILLSKKQMKQSPNSFDTPPPSRGVKDYSRNPTYTLGQIIQLQWTMDFTDGTLEIWTDSQPETFIEGAGATILKSTNATFYDWKVSYHGIDPTLTNVFYFYLTQPGRDRDGIRTGFSSHYFYIQSGHEVAKSSTISSKSVTSSLSSSSAKASSSSTSSASSASSSSGSSIGSSTSTTLITISTTPTSTTTHTSSMSSAQAEADQSANSDSTVHHSLTMGQAVGAAIGGIIGFILITALAGYAYWQRRRAKRLESAAKAPTNISGLSSGKSSLNAKEMATTETLINELDSWDRPREAVGTMLYWELTDETRGGRGAPRRS